MTTPAAEILLTAIEEAIASLEAGMVWGALETLKEAGMAAAKTKRLHEAGYKRRPTWRSLPSDAPYAEPRVSKQTPKAETK